MKYRRITFPKDAFPHNTIIEWLYFNGNLKDSRGNEYSFMNCLFRADPKKVKIPFLNRIPLKFIYFSHSIVSDIKRKKTYYDINPILLKSSDSFSKPLFFINYTPPSLKGYLNYEIEETEMFEYRMKSRFLELVLASKKKPLLEGGKGFLRLGSKETYYYSLTNLETGGWLILDGKRIKVKGKSWMDHQWADVPFSADKWSWFSIQFENDMEMVCFEYDDCKRRSCLASIMDRKGNSRHTTGAMLFPGNKIWKSPETGAEYPLSWKIKVPEFGVDIKVSAVLKDQEVLFSTINYWEGAVRVSGTLRGRKTKAKGFMELASYPMSRSLLRRYRGRLERSLKNEIIQTKERLLDMHRSFIYRNNKNYKK